MHHAGALLGATYFPLPLANTSCGWHFSHYKNKVNCRENRWPWLFPALSAPVQLGFHTVDIWRPQWVSTTPIQFLLRPKPLDHAQCKLSARRIMGAEWEESTRRTTNSEHASIWEVTQLWAKLLTSVTEDIAANRKAFFSATGSRSSSAVSNGSSPSLASYAIFSFELRASLDAFNVSLTSLWGVGVLIARVLSQL